MKKQDPVAPATRTEMVTLLELTPEDVRSELGDLSFTPEQVSRRISEDRSPSARRLTAYRVARLLADYPNLSLDRLKRAACVRPVNPASRQPNSYEMEWEARA